MFQIHFRDYGDTDTKYCYIKLNSHNSINTLHIAALRMRFSPLDNKLVEISILENCLTAYPELHKAITETLFPLLEKAHKSNVENIISIFMLIYDDVK